MSTSIVVLKRLEERYFLSCDSFVSFFKSTAGRSMHLKKNSVSPNSYIKQLVCIANLYCYVGNIFY